MKPIRILLADDHTLVRQGIRSLLEGQHGFDVIGEATDGIEAVDLIEREHPDVALMDIMMPNLNGLDATKQLTQLKIATKIIILSMHANSTYAIRALKSGAVGYLLKDADQEEIFNAIQMVVRGQRYITPQLSGKILDVLLHPDEYAGDPLSILTVRERQVLQMVAEGNTNNEIAEKLVLSPRTIEVHRARLMSKLEINSQVDLVRFAIQHGVIPLNAPLESDDV
jgi:two-component system, NarL family, response regulator NreC